MKFFLIIIVTVFTIYSCKENRNHEKNGTHSLKQKLIGKWGGLDESSPVLQFTVDSIYYFDRNKTYSYQINNNDIIINFPENKGILKNVSVVIDTMIFYDDLPEPVKAFRFK
ncbi:MAG: hypothetical protein KBF82_14495 [Chitinophagaceae bacterium]|nr:hypothetical protein [Chitinophagaceae bacterium]MBP8114433.1 hypothetical protein [Chitinophagaceae bacterium]MBP9105071.1 hypothetical protein [Chitinophagaceae bacterium]HQX72915.1 hypothetical protein [Chitinophagaceae bacterium]HQZ76255.1 hypothetical protein [Chitinophagaceae bacterium]